MEASDVQRAVAAATSIVAALDLAADNAIVLNNSNKILLRILPCDVVARVGYAGRGVEQFEVDIALRLAETNSPVAVLDPRVEPRVYERDGFAVTLWTYYEHVSQDIAATEYAQALARLHAGMREVDLPAPHFTDRVTHAQWLVDNRDKTPELADDDRALLSTTLRDLSAAISDGGAAEQLLHGEPHPGNLLNTKTGPVFIDLETCCRGPVEFDIAHAPEEVGEHYPTVNQELLRECRILTLALAATWRWEPDDQLPNGHQLGREWLSQIRAAVDR